MIKIEICIYVIFHYIIGQQLEMYALIKLNLLFSFLFLLRILDSCTGLMKAIRELILKSKDLQDEIVAEGRVRNAMGVMAKNCYYLISI